MSNKKDKEIEGQQPKAEAPASETTQTKTRPDNEAASADTKADAAASEEPVHPNPERAASDAAEAKAADNAQKAAEINKTEEPKVSDALVKIGKSILKSNPTMSVVYMASDGRGFYEKTDADNHARTLKNKAVTSVKK